MAATTYFAAVGTSEVVARDGSYSSMAGKHSQTDLGPGLTSPGD